MELKKENELSEVKKLEDILCGVSGCMALVSRIKDKRLKRWLNKDLSKITLELEKLEYDLIEIKKNIIYIELLNTELLKKINGKELINNVEEIEELKYRFRF